MRVHQSLEDGLLQMATAKLERSRAERYRDAMAVTFEAMAMAARYQYTQAINRAVGHASEESQRGLTTATVVARTVAAEMAAFANVSRATAIAPLEVLQYAYFDQVVGGRRLPMDTLFAGAARGKGRRGW
eukprot:3813274-Prymnesium_polylepis.1